MIGGAASPLPSTAPPGASPRASALPLWLLALGSAAVYAWGFDGAIALSSAHLGGEGHATHAFPLLYYPAFAAYLAAAWWVWRRPRAALLPVVLFAAIFRLLAVADAPALSSDVYRYPWDGRVQRAGESPYRYPPEAPELAALRDAEIHPRINRPWAITVYPPGAQVLYRLLPYDVDGVRFAMIAFDLLTIALLAWLLVQLGLEPARVVLYAWSPLVVYETAHSGHLEAAMLPLLVGAVLAWHARRHVLAGLLLGWAGAMKLYPLLAAPVLARRHPWRALGASAAVVGVLYLAYGWAVGTDVTGFLPLYVGVAEDHNIGLRVAFEALLAPVISEASIARGVAFGLCLALMAGGLTMIWRSRATLERRMLAVAGLTLVTLPTALHPWYALWLVPWLCVHLRASWLWLIGALPLSTLKYGSPGGVMPAWVLPVEWAPTAALWAFETRRGKTR